MHDDDDGGDDFDGSDEKEAAVIGRRVHEQASGVCVYPCFMRVCAYQVYRPQ